MGDSFSDSQEYYCGEPLARVVAGSIDQPLMRFALLWFELDHSFCLTCALLQDTAAMAVAITIRELQGMGRVAGKVAIVTGAASGMGKSDAHLLAREGAVVVVTDLNESDGQAVADEIGENAVFMRLNVTDEDNWKAVIAATMEKFGALDILVNNAGMIALGTIVDTDLESWRMINAVNSDGVFLGCKHAIPAMAESGGGSIINMSSVAAIHGQSFVAAYTASKGAVRALTKNIAMFCKEQKNGIRCNSIHPDGVKTPMVVKVATGKDTATQADIDEIGKFGNMCEPEDIANLVLFLASEESRFINGAEMLIDNASTITPPVGV
jgi:3(or 17)beta-hydroxysteroid dehydrogenase